LFRIADRKWQKRQWVFDTVPLNDAENAYLLRDDYGITNIGNDVWIGDKVIVIGGITIGDGAVVGAGAVVTHDVPPYAIVAGVPAKVIKYRFDDEKIRKLLDLKWWDWSEEEIKQNREFFISGDFSIVRTNEKKGGGT
jgi:acetyltransferase-like isoleucine patch superfamily enzyme